MGDFDPYHLWLQIPPSEQPPNHYRLLGLANFESDPDVIDNAADQRMVHLRSAQNGKKGQTAQQLMNEISRARLTLLDESRRQDYDEKLRQELEASQPPPPEADSGNGIPDFGSQSNKPQLVNTGATSKSLAYAKQKKKSANLTMGIIVGSVVVFAGLIYFLVVAGGGGGGKEKEIASDKKDTKPPKKKNLPKKDLKSNSKEPAKKKVVEPRKKPNTPVKTPEKQKDTKKPSGQKQPEKTKSSINPSQNSLDKFFAATFSASNEKSLAIGQPIEMLPLLKFPECLRQGVARNLKSKVVFESNVSYNQVDFPVFLPTHYDIEATVTRLSSEDGFGFGVHLANQPCFLMIDGFPTKRHLTGIRNIQGQDIDALSRTDVTRGQILPLDEPTKLKVSVRPTGVQLFANGELKYEWKGDPKELAMPKHMMPGTANALFQLWMMSFRARFQVEDVNLVPRGPAANDKTWLTRSTVPDNETLGTPVDILKKFDPTRVMVQPVAKSRFGLTLGPGHRAGTEIPVKLPPEYDLRMTVRLAGEDGLAVVLPMAGRRAALMIDLALGRRAQKTFITGLNMANGQYIAKPLHPGHLPLKLLPTNKDVPLDIKVRYDSVRLYVDGKFVYGWAGSRYRLNQPPWNGYPANSGKEYLRVVSLAKAVLIKKLTYRPVTQTNHAEFKDVVAKIQSINPPLKTFWSEYQRQKNSKVSANPSNGTPSLNGSGPTNSTAKSKTKLATSKSTVSKTEIDFAEAGIDPARLKWREFNTEELDEIRQLKSGLSRINEMLVKKEFDNAFEAIKTVNNAVELPESKQLLTGIAQVARDLKAFWQQIPSRCGLLKTAQQLEFSDTAAIVLEASKTELKLRSGGESKTYATDELPLGLALKIFEMTSSSKTKLYYRVRGSVFYVGSTSDPAHVTSALKSWLNVEKEGGKIDHLLALLSK